jgi:hypothetical protein
MAFFNILLRGCMKKLRLVSLQLGHNYYDEKDKKEVTHHKLRCGLATSPLFVNMRGRSSSASTFQTR